VVEQDIVTSIDHSTVNDILNAGRLQPRRFRYGKTTVWDALAVARTPQILGDYERIATLWQQGIVVIAVDEKPGIQVLERAAAQHPVRPGQIERQEFDYKRHSTINLLVGLTLFNGRMWAECLDKNDSEHFRPAIRRLLHPYGWAQRIVLIMDNGPSHAFGSCSHPTMPLG